MHLNLQYISKSPGTVPYVILNKFNLISVLKLEYVSSGINSKFYGSESKASRDSFKPLVLDKGTCYQVWRSKFNPWDLHGGRRKQLLTGLHTCMPIYKHTDK